MSAVTVRNLPDEIHRALKLRAVQNGRSTEAEIRQILEASVKPRLGLGTQLAAIGRSVGGVHIDIRRDPTPVKSAVFT
jgi:antitoxin FitA